MGAQFAKPVRALALAAAALLIAGTAAFAGGNPRERVYDDSFGNLVIISPAGYKRIVVGMGHVAVEMDNERAAIAAESGYRQARAPRCYSEPILWKGRSHMYGLADGEIPSPPVICN